MTALKESPIRTAGRGLFRLSCLLVGATFVLLLAGGQVTSTESGDSVPTWPFPIVLPLAGGVRWELSHRHVAGVVAILAAVIGALVFARSRSGDEAARPPTRVRRLAYAGLGLVLIQAALGGVRVLAGAADPLAGTPDESAAVRAIAITHACVAQVFLLLSVTLAWATSPRRRDPALVAVHESHRAAVVATIICFVQILLGALLRHTMTGWGLAIHVAGALAVVIAIATVAGRILGQSTDDSLRRPAVALGALLALQLFLGIAAYVLVNRGVPRTPAVTLQAIIPTIHLVLGATILALTWLIALQTTASDPSARGAFAPQNATAGSFVR